MTPDEIRKEVIADLGRFTHDPLGFVLWAFPWGVEGTSLANEDGPDTWQREQLELIGSKLRADPHTPIQDATASGHGIGKTSQVAWLILWALMTHEDTRGVCTANTEGQLRSKLWPEVSKWYSLLQFGCLREMFTLTATAVHSAEPGHDRTWRIDAIPWSASNVEAFAGLHNAGKRVIIVLDEASGIPEAIWETASGALTDAGTEGVFLAYGNPTKNSGRFKDVIVGRHRTQWSHRMIDSRTVKRTNKEQLQAFIDAYGEDSDFVRVRISGQFPRAGSNQFIGSDVVQAARKRHVEGLMSDPIVMGLDCARYGDDHSTLAIRCGRDARSFEWKRWHNQDAMQLAGDVALEARRWNPQAIFVDAGNIGAAVIDRLRQLGVPNVFEVWFGGKGRDAEWATGVRVKTKNKRAEIWTTMRAWLASGAIPDLDELEADLTGPEYGYAADQVSIQLEKKSDMKARGLPSPDDADALALTFAEPVFPSEHQTFYNPLDLPEFNRHARADRYAELDLDRW
jgi:hypothetical protein